MAGTLVKLATFPAVTSRDRIQIQGARKPSRLALMMCNVRVSPLRMQGFTGLRQLNAMDFPYKSGRDFHSLISALSPTSSQGRGKRVVPKAMLELFTVKAIKVIILAQEEARSLGLNFVGTEQILLGLIGEGTGIAAKVLKSLGISLNDARVEVEKIVGRSSGFVAVEIPFTPRAKHILELSLEEAQQLGHDDIRTEHLLLGLLREGEGVAARVLESLGADPSNIRAKVIHMVGESAEAVDAEVGEEGSDEQMVRACGVYGVQIERQSTCWLDG